MILNRPLLFSAVAASAWALPPGPGGGGGYGEHRPSGSPVSSGDSSQSSSTGTTVNGDSACSSYMCITATVKDSNVEYVMSTAESNAMEVGWMSIGFGSRMTDVPLVVMWENSDGQTSLSHRIATEYSEPDVDTSPPRTASVIPESTSSTGTSTSYAFSVPADGTTNIDLIWAFSNTRPTSSDVDARIDQHLGMGVLKLDLTNAIASSSNSTDTPSETNESNTDPIAAVPLTSSQKMVIAHGILLVVGFLFILPLGSLTARYARTFTDSWFKKHRAMQLYASAPIIIAGFALGVAAVSEAGVPHLNDGHKKWGVALFVLYGVQVGLGLFIHHIKLSVTRPPQNYLHAVLGLTIIGLSFYQVRTGYNEEWVKMGNLPLPNSVNIVWYIWVVILPLLYFGGLAFLPKQYRAERQRRRHTSQPLKRLETNYAPGY